MPPSCAYSLRESTASRQPLHLGRVPRGRRATRGAGERRRRQPVRAPEYGIARRAGAGRCRGAPHRPRGRRRRGWQHSRPRARLPRLTAPGTAMRMARAGSPGVEEAGRHDHSAPIATATQTTFAARPGPSVACATALLDARARVAATPARITVCAIRARHRRPGRRPHRPRASRREVFGLRVVVMARSDHSDPRAVPVDSDGAGLAAQRLVIGLHARQGTAREPTQSHLPTGETSPLATHAEVAYRPDSARSRCSKGGQKRTTPEIRALLASAGFRVTAVPPCRCRWRSR